LAPVTGGRIVVPIDHGSDKIPRYTFNTTAIPEPELYKENQYACPVQPIDTRPITFEMRRRELLLQNDAGEYDYDFDLIQCLDSELLKDMDQHYKDYIRSLSSQDRRTLKKTILTHNEWVTEFVPAAMACLACNTAGNIPFANIKPLQDNNIIYLIFFSVYPMGIGTSAKSIFVYCCLYLVKVLSIQFQIYYLIYLILSLFTELCCSTVSCVFTP
jgi:hypothetical protein